MSTSMPLRQRQRVLHFIGRSGQGPIGSPKISAASDDLWPCTPLAEWPLWLLDFYFDTLEAVVMADGREQ